MKIYTATFYRTGWGYSLDRGCVVVQLSSSAALGEVLMKYPDSSADEWTIKEVCLSDRSVIEMYEEERG